MLSFKKVCAVLLAGVLSCTVFAGCGGGTAASSAAPTESSTAAPAGDAAAPAGDAAAADVNEDGTVNNPESVAVDANKLVFWSLFSGGDGEFMDGIIKSYNETAPAMQVQSVMLVWGDYYTKLATAVAANKGPDIGVSHISKLPELVEQGIVTPIDDFATKSGTDWSKYTESMNAGITFDGAHYAMPLDTHAEIMYFNKDILEKAGVTLNDKGQIPIASDADFKAVLDKLKAGAGEGISPLSLTQKGDDPYRTWWATYFQMGGTPLVNEAGDAVTLDKDIAAKAADYVNALYKDGYIQGGIEDHQKFFQGGSAGLMFGGTWATGAFEKTDGLNFGAQAFPKLFNNDSCWADAHVMTIPTNKRRDEARTQASVDFINYVCTTGAIDWAGSGQIPSNIDVQASAEYKALPYRSDYAAAAQTAILPSKNASFYSMKDAIIKCLDTIWSGQASSADAITSMYDQIESNL